MHDTDAFVTRRRLSTKECSVEARKILKAAFPGTKFSVRTEHHTSVNVSWTDGPTTKQVDRLIGHLKAGHFDGMNDMYVYNDGPEEILANEDGTIETVEYGAHYVFTSRTISDAWRSEIFEIFREKIGPDSTLTYGDPTDRSTWGQTVPLWVASSYGTDEPGELLRMVDSEQNDIRDVFHRYVADRSR